MKMFIEPGKIYLHRDFVDFRKSINGLSAIVEHKMSLPLFDGALFVFCNKSRDKLKILYWDKTGFALWQKRLEKARFKWPHRHALNQLRLTEQQLQWLLSGFDVIGHTPVFYGSASL